MSDIADAAVEIKDVDVDLVSTSNTSLDSVQAVKVIRRTKKMPVVAEITSVPKPVVSKNAPKNALSKNVSAKHAAENEFSSMGVNEMEKVFSKSLVTRRGSHSFEIEKNSHFPDGYSIAGEKKVLDALFDSKEPDILDPNYNRWLEWHERVQKFEVIKKNSKNNVVILKKQTPILFKVHTPQAVKLFNGDYNDKNAKYKGCALSVAHALKELCWLHGADNPYASWYLSQYEDYFDEVSKLLTVGNRRIDEQLESLNDSNIVGEIFKSKNPEELSLFFKLPYGYRLATMIGSFDNFVCGVSSLKTFGLLEGKHARDLLQNVLKEIGAFFRKSYALKRSATDYAVIDVRRSDFLYVLDHQNEESDQKKKVMAAVSKIGLPPKEILCRFKEPAFCENRNQLGKGDANDLSAVWDLLNAALPSKPQAVPAVN
jgi:integrating conjugative element protein (TIGR03761 family)